MKTYKIKFIGIEELLKSLETSLEEDFEDIEEETCQALIELYHKTKQDITFLKENAKGFKVSTFEEYQSMLKRIRNITQDYVLCNDGTVISFE